MLAHLFTAAANTSEPQALPQRLQPGLRQRDREVVSAGGVVVVARRASDATAVGARAVIAPRGGNHHRRDRTRRGRVRVVAWAGVVTAAVATGAVIITRHAAAIG